MLFLYWIGYVLTIIVLPTLVVAIIGFLNIYLHSISTNSFGGVFILSAFLSSANAFFTVSFAYKLFPKKLSKFKEKGPRYCSFIILLIVSILGLLGTVNGIVNVYSIGFTLQNLQEITVGIFYFLTSVIVFKLYLKTNPEKQHIQLREDEL